MGILIYLDDRERALIEYTKRADFGDGAWMEWRIGKLDVGDIQIQDTKSHTHLVFERKTFQDIASSIKDGRYKEQKARLLAGFRPEQIMYILEDFNTQLLFTHRPRTSFFGLSKATYEGFFFNTMYRDKIHIHRSSGVEETFFFILEIAKRLYQDASPFCVTITQSKVETEDIGTEEAQANPVAPPTEPPTAPSQYIDVCKIKGKKIKNITPLVCFQLQLGQIPTISSSISKQITQHFTSMKALLEALEMKPTYEEKRQLLTSIPLVGKKKADGILTFLGYMADTDLEIHDDTTV